MREHCPRCDEALEPHSCKLACPRCGYFADCSDHVYTAVKGRTFRRAATGKRRGVKVTAGRKLDLGDD